MKFVVSNKIFIFDPTQEICEWCERDLVISNPDYEKKVRMGLWTGNTPRKYALYEKAGNCIIVPFGHIYDLYSKYHSCYEFENQIKLHNRVFYDSNIKLYDYQKNAVQAILGARNGILVMPCGSGKTNCGMELIFRIGMPALWLTHTQDLLNQSLARAKSVLGISQSSYGTITGGKINIGSGITFATVQTMSKIDLGPYKDQWGCIIVDECHKAVGTPTKAMQFYKVLNQLSCRYKFGLTATPKRSDGLEKTMFGLIGEVAYEVSRDEVLDTTCPVSVISIDTNYSPDLSMALCGDGTINYAGLVDDLTHNEERFNCVSSVINSFNGAMLVLGNRVDYLKRLNESYEKKSVCLSAMGNSKSAKAERKETLRKLNEGEIDCVFATYQLAKEGLDVPNLRYVVFATPEKDETTVIQSAGRVSRKADGKDMGYVIDFIDNFGMLIGWHKKRQNIFKRKLNFILT